MCFIYFSPSQSGCPPRFKNFPQTRQCKTPFVGRISILSSVVSFLIFYVLSYLPSKTMGCFSGHLMTSASDQKLFCEVCSAFSYSFDEFVREKVVSPSYSSAILAPPLLFFLWVPSSFTCTQGAAGWGLRPEFFLPKWLRPTVQLCRPCAKACPWLFKMAAMGRCTWNK